MNLPARLLAFAAAGLVAAAPAAAAPDLERMVALAGSILRIEAPRPGGGFAIGSAVTVGPELVVTNCHVTREARRIEVVRGGVRWPADTQLSDAARDLCLLHVPGLRSPAVELGRAALLAPGQPVVALGYTGGVGIQNSAGEVQHLHRHDGGVVIQSSNFFNSGASGGGLFDEGGRMVGVLTFRLRGGERHYYAAPAEWVAQMVERAGRGELRPVAPLDRQPLPYWESAAPPRFLQAQRLHASGQWAALERLAVTWVADEADEAEAWHWLGAALQHQGRDDAARAAFACALRLEPAHRFASDENRLLAAAPRPDPPAACGHRKS